MRSEFFLQFVGKLDSWGGVLPSVANWPPSGKQYLPELVIESCLATVRYVARNVKRWRGGAHLARWTAAGLAEAEKKFRKVKGYRELKELNRILNPELHSQAQVA